MIRAGTLERHFGLDLPFGRFARNVAVLSLAGLLPLLVLYIALQPGFGAMLLDGGPAVSRLGRQVLTNGLPVVFAVNYLGFVLYGALARAWWPERAAALLLLIDPPLRLAAFVSLHALIYVASADWFGSFGGDRLTALRVVAPTLARAASFENLSGVYLYAALVGALPVHVAALRTLLTHRRPTSDRPSPLPASLAIAVAWNALFAVVLTTCAAAVGALADD